MSLMIKGMCLPKHAAFNGEKDTAYRCIVLVHPDNTVELVIDTEFASAYDNGHNIQRYPITEIPTPHGGLIDADDIEKRLYEYWHNDCPFDKVNPYVAYQISSDRVKETPTIIEAEGADNEWKKYLHYSNENLKIIE